jgi:hypothetical protein
MQRAAVRFARLRTYTNKLPSQLFPQVSYNSNLIHTLQMTFPHMVFQCFRKSNHTIRLHLHLLSHLTLLTRCTLEARIPNEPRISHPLQRVWRLCIDTHISTQENEDLGHSSRTGVLRSNIGKVLILHITALGTGSMLINTSRFP